MSPSIIDMNAIEIKGNATLCFDESGVNFQGVIQSKDDTQFAIYGTKTGRHIRKWSQLTAMDNAGPEICGCPDEVGGPGIPVTYDIRIVDCEVGEEYILRKVHGRNGENVSLRCKSINFNTAQFYKGQRADMESQRVIGHKMEGGGGTTVYKGPIEITTTCMSPVSRPWVL